MGILLSVSGLALRGAVGAACEAAGVQGGVHAVDGVVRLLRQRFTDHSQRLTRALQTANDRTWRALEVALAGDSWWERCKVRLASGEERGFRDQLRSFLDAN